MLTDEHGNPFEIPQEGSLGLLALGYTGLMLWRAKRRELTQQRTTNPTKDNTNEAA